MKAIKRVFSISIYKIRRWRTNYRVWFIALYVVFFTYNFTGLLPEACKLAGEKVGPWLMPFLFSNHLSLINFALPFVILFCDAPFLDKNQPYIIVRSGRKIWAWGQITYIVISSFIYSIYLNLVIIVMNLRCIEFTNGWGSFIEDPKANDFLYRAGIFRFHIEEFVIQNFKPLQAMCWSFVFFWFVGILLGLLIFCLNSVASSRVFGTVIASIVLVFASISYNYPTFYKFSPVSWVMITYIFDEREFFRFTSPALIAVVYFALFAALIIVIMIHNRKRTIEVLPPV